MSDASDYAMGAVLGQRTEKIFKAIYYASKTFNEAQDNYSNTEKEMLIMVFSCEKFRPYILGSHVIIHTDHTAIKHLRRRRRPSQDLSDGYCCYRNLILRSKIRREATM